MQQVAVGGVDVDAVAGVAHVVIDDAGTVYRVQVNAVATVLRTYRGVTLDAVADHAHVLGAIDPDAKALALQAVAQHLRATRLGLDEHSGVHGREVGAPIEERAALDADIRRADQQAVALPFGLEDGAGGAGQLQRLVDAERAPVLAGRQAPTVGAVGLQG